jgi:hypothetical protein
MKRIVLISAVLIAPLLNSCATAGQSNPVSVPSDERYYPFLPTEAEQWSTVKNP